MATPHDAERLVVEEEFVGLAKAMLACIVKLSAMSSSPCGIKPKTGAPTAAPPPDIPDAPPAAAVPPDVPEVDASTGEVARTDEQVIADLDDAYATAATESELAEHIEANKGEVERRGLEQAAGDLADKHRRRINRARAAAAKSKSDAEVKMGEDYVRIMRDMRGAGDKLGAVWKAAQADIKAMPKTWRAELAAEKDRLKAQLQQLEKAA